MAILDNPATGLVAGSVVATTSAAAIGAAQRIREVLVRARSTNSVEVLVGSSASQVIRLAAGDAVPVPIDDLSKVYVKTAAGSGDVDYLATT